MSYLSDFEHAKLDAHVFPGMIVETQCISDATTGQRKVPQTKIWNVERTLGKGGFGEVRLETHKNEKRAVKRIWATGSTFKVQYERELQGECGIRGLSGVVSRSGECVFGDGICAFGGLGRQHCNCGWANWRGPSKADRGTNLGGVEDYALREVCASRSEAKSKAYSYLRAFP